jgi:hypothetical protein
VKNDELASAARKLRHLPTRMYYLAKWEKERREQMEGQTATSRGATRCASRRQGFVG